MMDPTPILEPISLTLLLMFLGFMPLGQSLLIPVMLLMFAGTSVHVEPPVVSTQSKIMPQITSQGEQPMSQALSSEEILAALDCLTRRKDETYEQFITRAAANPLARKVKLADLKDNMDLRRLPALNDEDLPRLQRYVKAWYTLTQTP